MSVSQEADSRAERERLLVKLFFHGGCLFNPVIYIHYLSATLLYDILFCFNAVKMRKNFQQPPENERTTITSKWRCDSGKVCCVSFKAPAIPSTEPAPTSVERNSSSTTPPLNVQNQQHACGKDLK